MDGTDEIFKQEETKAANSRIYGAGKLRFLCCLLLEKIVSARAPKSRRESRVLPDLLQRDRLLRFFDDFFEARVAAQRLPERQQFQVTVAESARATDHAV